MHLSLTLDRSAAAASRASRTAWASGALLSGFVATFALAIVLALDYAFVAAVGTAHGDRLARWAWALGHPSVGSMHGDRISLAIALTLLLGLVAALAHARFVEPRASGAGWRGGTLFALAPWLLAAGLTPDVIRGGLFGVALNAGPLPLLGSLLAFLAYGVVLGAMHGMAPDTHSEPGANGTPHWGATERGAALGIALGLLVGAAAGWALGVGDGATAAAELALGGALTTAAIGAFVGSLLGLDDRARLPDSVREW